MGVGVFASKYDKEENEQPPVELQIYDGNRICAWFSQKDDIYYFFIPSYAELNSVFVSIADDSEIFIDDKHISDGEALEGFEYNTHYLLTDESGRIRHNLVFLKSDNVSTVYVDTANNSMKAVLDSKKHKERARITVVDKNGTIDTIRTDAYVKGRGNSTWLDFDKKPFAIVFDKPESMLNMAASSRWALLANAVDKSGIRNAIVFDTARNVGLDNTPEYRYVDLYLNGEYNGLYMLCQTAETFMERMDINENGLFVFTPELLTRKEGINYPVYVENKEAIVDVVYPKKLRSNDKRICESILYETDEMISSGNDNIGEIIDIDSWVKKYLIDEIFENYDSGLASSYFYSVNDGYQIKVYAGPIWDYDNTMGISAITKNPETLFANQTHRSKTDRILWYHELYTNDVFYDDMVDTFMKEYLPQLDMLIETGICNLANEISISKANNDIRWEIDSSDEYDRIIDYLTKRKDFLIKVWGDNEEYVEVTFYNSSGYKGYYRLSVPKGASISSVDCAKLGIDETDKWYIDGTAEEYDFDVPVINEVVLVNASRDNISIIDMIKENRDVQKMIFVFCSILLLPMFLLVFKMCTDFRKG